MTQSPDLFYLKRLNSHSPPAPCRLELPLRARRSYFLIPIRRPVEETGNFCKAGASILVLTSDRHRAPGLRDAGDWGRYRPGRCPWVRGRGKSVLCTTFRQSYIGALVVANKKPVAAKQRKRQAF